MKKILLLFTFTILFNAFTFGQATVNLPDITATPGTDISVPIDVTGFSNLGAISIVINYDSNVLTFESNPDPLTTGNFFINNPTGQIRIGWFGTTALNVTDGALLHLNFKYLGGTTNLQFVEITSTSIASSAGDSIITTYKNGSVSPLVVIPTSTGSIGDYVWNDLDSNGIQQDKSLEPPLKNVNVKLFDANTDSNASGIPFKTTTTDSAGNYEFTNLPSGNYKVKFELLSGFVFSPKKANTGNSPNGDSDADITTGLTDLITLADSEHLYGIDAGMYVQPVSPLLGSVGDFVWNDINKDGIQDNSEVGIKDVIVKLLDANNNDSELKTTTTDTQGKYSFLNLSAGNYKILVTLPLNYNFSPINASTSTDDNNSDVNPSTGKTDAFALTAGENLTNKDAGMYFVSVPTGSIGDYVWNDLDSNGVQRDKNLEPPLENVTVKLFDAVQDPNGTGVPLQTAVTDSDGNYQFSVLPGGIYKVKFELLNGFVFSPQRVDYPNSKDGDSDPDVTTGLTDAITLSENENLYGIDAGMFASPVVVKTPNPNITVSDGIEVSPDSGLTTTYTIIYANVGDGNLLNTVITDTLPSGYAYVSNTGVVPTVETNNNIDVLKFQIGTMPSGFVDTIFVTVKVSAIESDYTNIVSLSGNDDNNKLYMSSAKDINLYDQTSGGGDAGLESKGDLASLLLKRQLLIRYGRTTPMLAINKSNSLTAQHTLDEFYPATGPFNSQGVVTTPFDILGISNAISSYAMDYNMNIPNGQRRVAGIFSTITTAPYIYDHTKAVCDRLGGSVIGDIRLIEINGYKFYATKLVNEKKEQTDYSVSFSVYETPSGYQLQNKWTYAEYISPTGASSVYNFQVWSSTYDGTIELVKNILSKISSVGSLTYLNTNQIEPNVYVKNSNYSHDGTIHLTIMNLGNASQISISNKYRISQGDALIEKTENIFAQKGENEIVLSTGIISDANLTLTSSTGFKDETFVSGGSYTNISGPNSTVSSFSTVNFAQPVITNYQSGSMLLSGGVSISGNLGDWISVIRSFSAAGTDIDLSNYKTIKFNAKGTGILTLIFDLTNTQNFNYFSYSVNLTSELAEYAVNFSDLNEIISTQNQFDPKLVRNIGFVLYKTENPNLTNFNFEVSNIVFSPNLITGIEDEQLVPKEFTLSQNYPNPFNPTTTIRFTLPEASMVTLKIYNMLGQEVKTLVNEQKNAGTFNVQWNGDNDFSQKVSSGTYIYRVIAGQNIFTKKMILLK